MIPPPRKILTPPPRLLKKAHAVAPTVRASDAQESLFELEEDWRKEWNGMPRFEQKDLESWQSIKVHFKSKDDRESFGAVVEQTVTDLTNSIWYPKATKMISHDKGFITDGPVNPRHPVYVISKGRWESRLTSRSLERLGVPYSIVVEPQEFDQYASVVSPDKILTLPFRNLGQGSIPARNWVWEHSIKSGAAWHWILDDNINGFWRLHDNLKTRVGTGAIFKAAEDFVERYDNVVEAGFNYYMFAPQKSDAIKPFTLNTRIYSCILLRNDIQHRWRGRYNEDTDLSIRILKDGWCTILFNAFLAWKMTTMHMKGGNTDELYKDDGRLKMAESLAEQHPDIVTITEKWGRPQHQVYYGGFKKNKLRKKQGITIKDGPDDYGMKLVAGDFRVSKKDEE